MKIEAEEGMQLRGEGGLLEKWIGGVGKGGVENKGVEQHGSVGVVEGSNKLTR